MNKTERLLTLMDVLLSTSRPLDLEEIRARVPGYPDNPESFRRSFERDKVELRDMGVPLQIADVLASDPPTVGYRILPKEYALRDPGLEPDELEALTLAQALIGTGDGGALALLKLGGGIATADRPQAEVPADPELANLFAAVAERRVVEFRYRDLDREVHPYRLQFMRGRWYLNGFDRARGEDRWYRLDRIASKVEVGTIAGAFERPIEAVPGLRVDPWVLGDHSEPTEVVVRFDTAVAAAVRAEIRQGEVLSDDDDGLVVRLTVTNPPGFRSWLLSFLDRAEILEPAEVRDAFVADLEHHLDG